MSNFAALFQILYQNDTLFQLTEEIKTPEPSIAKEQESTPEAAVTVPLLQAAIENLPEPVAIVPQKISAQPVKVEAKTIFPALNHKVLILTDDSKNKMLVDSEALLLDNILKAVGHSSVNSDILNFSFLAGSDARQVLSEKRTNFFITFGVPLIKLHLDLLLVPYAPKMVEGIWFLLADPLAVIDADKALKKKLWLALQKMFEKA